jgi:hypothetical protein
MTYNPEEAKKSYAELLKENGTTAAIQSLIFVITWYLFNRFIMGVDTSPYVLGGGYVFFCIYFVWKPKLIRYLRKKVGQPY